MDDSRYPSLATFAADLTHPRSSGEPPAYAHPCRPPVFASDDTTTTAHLEEVIDTIVALQRSEWLEEGVYLGPRSLPDVYAELLSCTRRLQMSLPPAIATRTPTDTQSAYGTNSRHMLLLSTSFAQTAHPLERRFVLGRLCGHAHARQVTWRTLYALLTGPLGLRRVAKRLLGPSLDLLTAPLSIGARLALARWHRAAEVTADRAAMICMGDLGSTLEALLRHTLGVDTTLSAEAYLEQLRRHREPSSPSRWTEVLATRPFLRKRIHALELFARSTPWLEAGGEAAGPPLSVDDLHGRTDALLRVDR